MNDLEEPTQVEEPKEKINEVPEYFSNNFWRLEEHLSVDDLLADYQ